MKGIITCSVMMLLLCYMVGKEEAAAAAATAAAALEVVQWGPGTVNQVIKYYVHDNLLQKEGNTAHVIAGPGGNVTHLQQGSLVAINDLITEGPDPSSPKLGHAQGVYLVSTFFPDLPHLHQQFTSVFTAKYNGTISYQGDDGHLLLPQREIAVVGGTGQFRSASGYCFIRTVKQTDAWSYILEFETHLSVPTVTDDWTPSIHS